MDQRGMPERIGPFEIVRRLGSGGMAEAFEGRRIGPGGFEQRVCVKRVLPSYAKDPELAELFVREARIAGSLSHRNVARVVEFGADAEGHYLALELVDGLDLRRLLAGNRTLPASVVALIGRDVAAALDHLHTRRGKMGPIVHRDVTPANVLVSVDGDVKLTDFGIAKAHEDDAITRESFVRGNVWYMAPERLDGASDFDVRSDLFSLGVVLYQCIAGRRPYDGMKGVTSVRALSEGRRVPLSEAAPSAPMILREIVDRLLAEDRDRRWPSAGQVAEALGMLVDASARQTLSTLVRARRADRQRAVARVEPITVSLSALELEQEGELEPPGKDATRDLSPQREGVTGIRARREDDGRVPPRWRPYARGPRAWACLDDAMRERALVSADTRPARSRSLRG